MNKFIFVMVLLLAGCSTVVPVARHFPDVPADLQKKCEDLKTIEGNKVSVLDLMRTVVENYKLHYECSNRTEAWQDWYKVQKEIFDEVK